MAEPVVATALVSDTVLEGSGQDSEESDEQTVEENSEATVHSMQTPIMSELNNCTLSSSDSIEQPGDYFLIISKANSKVLVPKMVGQRWVVRAEDYSDDKDSQLWFWDGDSIRSKILPCLAVDISTSRKTRSVDDYNDYYDYSQEEEEAIPVAKADVELMPFIGGDGQRWILDGKTLKSMLDDKTLQLELDNTVTARQPDGSLNQKWSLDNTARAYFTIVRENSVEVLTATKSDEVSLHFFQGKDNQIWFWDEGCIRSKTYPDKVLDLHTYNYENTGKGNVFLHSFHGGDNQQWHFENKSLVSSYKNLRLDLHGFKVVGDLYRENKPSQMWYMEIQNVNDIKKPKINRAWSWKDNAINNIFLSQPGKYDAIESEPTNQIPRAQGYFRISSKANSKVLVPKKVDQSWIVKAEDYSVDKDNQLWFWGGDSIRPKTLPNLGLDIRLGLAAHSVDALNKDEILLTPFKEEESHKWIFDGKILRSQSENLALQLENDNTVTATQLASSLNQKWSLDISPRVYFTIVNKNLGRVVAASSPDSINLSFSQGTNDQVWFWDGDCIRSKAYPDKVLDLHMFNYERNGKGNVYLHSFHGGNNQQWHFGNDSLVTSYNNLHLDINGSVVVGSPFEDGKISQLWYMDKQDGSDIKKPKNYREWSWNNDAVKPQAPLPPKNDLPLPDPKPTSWYSDLKERAIIIDDNYWHGPMRFEEYFCSRAQRGIFLPPHGPLGRLMVPFFYMWQKAGGRNRCRF